MKISKISALLLILVFALSCTTGKQENKHPNVILIYTDDQGAIVYCSGGIPAFSDLGLTFPGTPARCGVFPVNNPARDGEQTGAP